MKLSALLLLLSQILLSACVKSDGESRGPGPVPTYDVSGLVTYDFVPIVANGLDYANTSQKPIRNVRIEARSANTNTILASSTTNSSGNYLLKVPQNAGEFYIAVISQMISPSITVEDNTNSNAIYLAASNSVFLTGNFTFPNLNATSGWFGANNSGSYSATRAAAPFAILDSTYSAYLKFKASRPNLTFPPLKINWSKDNIPVSGDVSIGQISTSHYDGSELYILGKADVDSDEFDRHVVVHEWGHFVEDKISRSDSPGGQHSQGDLLHMSLAFGEAWGNATSAIVFDPDIYYRDSYGARQQFAFGFSMETDADPNPGWYSESSIQQILYDIYDTSSDAGDNVQLGLGPIIDVMTIHQKNTPALTSIFSFITGLKNISPASEAAIDTLLAGKNIDSIQDIWGSSETNDGGEISALPIYNNLLLNNIPVPTQISGQGSRSNEFHNNRFYRFTAASNTTRLSWNSSDTFILMASYLGDIFWIDGFESDGSPLTGFHNLSTVPGRQYVITLTTNPNFVHAADPIDFTLSVQAL